MNIVKHMVGTALAGCFLISANTLAAVDTWTKYLSTSRADTPVWAKTLRNTFSAQQLGAQLAQGDVIGTIGGPNDFDPTLGKAEAALGAYILQLQQGGLASYQAKVYAAALDAIAFEKSSGNTVYWLLGNEINSKAHSASWDAYADGEQTGRANDLTYIPAFAEYFLGPLVETLLRVEADTGADIHMMMGSIANGSGTAQRAWATALLEYKFVGTYAPSLAGKRVADLMEYLAIHYSITDDNWEDTLDFYSAWKGKSAVRGIMDTEEIGNQAMDRGAAQYQALLGFSRTLHWVAKNDRSALDFRMNYWSEGQDYANEAMTLLHGFLGDTTLAEMTAPTVTSTGTTETYAFKVDGKRVLFVFTGMQDSVTLTNVQFAAQSNTATAAGSMYVFDASTTGTGPTTSAVLPVNSGVSYGVGVNVTIPKEGVAMFLLEETVPVPPIVVAPTPVPPIVIDRCAGKAKIKRCK